MSFDRSDRSFRSFWKKCGVYFGIAKRIKKSDPIDPSNTSDVTTSLYSFVGHWWHGGTTITSYSSTSLA